ncbi:MAG: NADH-quinone oxidoreductase subunit A [Bacteroidota bacterium]
MNPDNIAFGQILVYLLGGAGIFSLLLLVVKLLAPDRPNPEKNTSYECGEDAIGSGIVQFNPRFYLIGLIFLIFDLEVIFIFPLALVYADPELVNQIPGWGILALAEIGIFIGILLVGFAYVWVKGDLDWVIPSPITPEIDQPVPLLMYEELNKKYSKSTPPKEKVLE